jgi:hypothetical protein
MIVGMVMGFIILTFNTEEAKGIGFSDDIFFYGLLVPPFLLFPATLPALSHLPFFAFHYTTVLAADHFRGRFRDEEA